MHPKLENLLNGKNFNLSEKGRSGASGVDVEVFLDFLRPKSDPINNITKFSLWDSQNTFIQVSLWFLGVAAEGFPAKAKKVPGMGVFFFRPPGPKKGSNRSRPD